MASETEWVAIKGTPDYLSRCGKFRAWYKRTAKDGYADYLVSYASAKKMPAMKDALCVGGLPQLSFLALR